MQRLEVSGAVRPIYGLLDVKRNQTGTWRQVANIMPRQLYPQNRLPIPRRWVGPRASPEDLKTRKISCSWWESNPWLSSP